MFKMGMEIIKNFTDYCLKYMNNGKLKILNKSLKSIDFLIRQHFRGFDYKCDYRVGDFVWVEYGDNPEPELSFEHLGIVIMRKNHGYYTLPITTPKEHNKLHMNAYHKKDNPKGNNNFILIKKEDFPFLSHDSVIKVSELKLVSEKRLRNLIGHIAFEDEKMQEIIKIAHRFYFPTYDYKLKQLEKENSLLRLNFELEKIKTQYELETFEQISSILPYNKEFSINFSKPICIKENHFETIITLTDKYSQNVSKKIIYILDKVYV